MLITLYMPDYPERGITTYSDNPEERGDEKTLRVVGITKDSNPTAIHEALLIADGFVGLERSDVVEFWAQNEDKVINGIRVIVFRDDRGNQPIVVTVSD